MNKMTPQALLLVVALVVSLTACTSVPAAQIATPTTPPPMTPTVTASVAMTVTMAVVTAAPSPVATPAKIQYTVRPGDTLLGIAVVQHVSMASIQLANGLGDGDVLRAGQVLNIPAGPQWDGESPYWIVHIVQQGETLTGIAQTFDMTTRDILRVNAIADPEQIKPGQPIVIPLNSLRATVQPTLTARPTVLPTRASTPTGLTPRPATPTLPPTLAPADIATWPETVVALINQKRAAHGLPPYSIAPGLARSAQGQADDCAMRGWCSHVGSDGSDTRTREMRAGYNPTVWGENWVQALDPAKAVDWWYNETPPDDAHRKNLLHTLYVEIGVGIAQAEYGYYFIADFGRQ